MKIFKKGGCQTKAPDRKFPGIYRDSRDGEVVLMLDCAHAMVLEEGNGCVSRSTRRPVGHVMWVSLGDYDHLVDGEYVISN